MTPCEQYALLELYYRLGDGLIWHPQIRLAWFTTRASALAFKLAAPTWEVWSKTP